MSWYLVAIVWLCAAAYALYWIAGRAGVGRLFSGVFAAVVVAAYVVGWVSRGASPAGVVAATPSAAPAAVATVEPGAQATAAAVARATPDPAIFRESLTDLQLPEHVSLGRPINGSVMVENRSPRMWLAHNAVPVLLGVSLVDASGHFVREGRSATHADFAPGAKRRISFDIGAPDARGRYTLKVDMVFEGYAWFESQGGKPATQVITVE